jgi:crossover junction endodeoxyribonuclease RuvC
MTGVLGIDPGLQITGFALVAIDDGRIDPQLVEAGVIRLDRKLSMEQRLVQLEVELSALIEAMRPQVLAVEKLYAHYKHPRTAIIMGHARGVILLCAQRCGMRIDHLPSTEVKKAMTGYGHASKQQIQEAVKQQCGLSKVPKPPDVADAIAIAMTSARRVALGADR